MHTVLVSGLFFNRYSWALRLAQVSDADPELLFKCNSKNYPLQRTVTDEIHFLCYNFQTTILSNALQHFQASQASTKRFQRFKTISFAHGKLYLTNLGFTNSLNKYIYFPRQIINVITNGILCCFINWLNVNCYS